MSGEALIAGFDLTDRVAIITGAAAGIGKATARLFAAAGATVVVADLDPAGARAVAEEIGGFPVPFDLADDGSIGAMVRATNGKFGRLDILVNNAGIYPRFSLNDATEANWQQLQKVNVWGCLVALREAAAVMLSHERGGRIINVSSIGGARTAINDQVLYNATKAALDAITKSTALELAPHGITVNSLLPGAVLPLDPKPRAAGHTPPSGPLVDPGRIPLGRFANADEIARPLLMLASDAGSYITGQTIIVDGGFSVS